MKILGWVKKLRLFCSHRCQSSFTKRLSNGDLVIFYYCLDCHRTKAVSVGKIIK